MSIGLIITPKKNKYDKILSEEWNAFIDNFILLDKFLQNTNLKRIETGIIKNIPTSSHGVVSGQVNFSQPFTKTPKVFLTFYNLDMRVTVENLNVVNVNQNSFIWAFRVKVGFSNTYTNLFYLAIEQL